MKAIIVSGLVLLGGYAGAAVAGCDSPVVSAERIEAVIKNKLVCGRPGTGYPGGRTSPDRWQEEHQPSGHLWDYKLGPGPSVDPRKKVGTWSLSGNLISHSYTGGSTYTWTLHNNGGTPSTFSFCTGGAEHVLAYIKPLPGSAGCSGSFPP